MTPCRDCENPAVSGDPDDGDHPPLCEMHESIYVDTISPAMARERYAKWPQIAGTP